MQKPGPSSPPDTRNTYRITIERNVVGEYCLELEKRLLAEIEHITTPLVLDLSQTTNIDSRGLGICIGLFKECQRKGISLSIDINPALMPFFKLMKLHKILHLNERDAP